MYLICVIYIYIYTHTYRYIYIYMYIDIYIYRSMCTYIYMCIYTYRYIRVAGLGFHSASLTWKASRVGYKHYSRLTRGPYRLLCLLGEAIQGLGLRGLTLNLKP